MDSLELEGYYEIENIQKILEEYFEIQNINGTKKTRINTGGCAFINEHVNYFIKTHSMKSIKRGYGFIITI